MFAICRYLWSVLLSENTGRNGVSGCINAICYWFTKRSYRKYFQFLHKTTHLTGTTTDLGILFSMFTHKNTEKSGAYCQSESIVKHYDCLCSRSCILRTYLLLSGVQSFYVISLCLLVVIGYDAYKIHLRHFNTRYRHSRIYRKPTILAYLYDKIHGIQKKGKTKIHFRRLNILLVLILCKTSCEPSSICVNI